MVRNSVNMILSKSVSSNLEATALMIRMIYENTKIQSIMLQESIIDVKKSPVIGINKNFPIYPVAGNRFSGSILVGFHSSFPGSRLRFLVKLRYVQSSVSNSGTGR